MSIFFLKILIYREFFIFGGPKMTKNLSKKSYMQKMTRHFLVYSCNTYTFLPKSCASMKHRPYTCSLAMYKWCRKQLFL